MNIQWGVVAIIAIPIVFVIGMWIAYNPNFVSVAP